MTSFIVLALSVAIVVASGVYGGLEESLKYWETLSMSSIKRRIVKRDAASQYPAEQLINFESYGREFSILLRKDFSVLASGFKVLAFEANGTSQELHLDLNIYRGNVLGEGRSFVNGYFNDNNMLTASIQTDSELYAVEPATNLNPNATNDMLIIYRESDLIWDNSSRCGYVNDYADELKNITNTYRLGDKLETITETNQFGEELKPITPLINETQNTRRKRSCSGTALNTCTLYLVADPKFIRTVAKGNLKDTANKLVNVINTADNIYRGETFDGCDTGYGFEVRKIHLFADPSESYAYTADRTFKYDEFLKGFSEDDSLLRVCLGHIFTYQEFNDDGGWVLGLAYTGNADPNKRGGICSASPVHRNSGFTSRRGRNDITERQAELVTAHGHNWGSPHDQDNPRCAPPSSKGGKYLMFPVSVGGDDEHNDNFSPCSLTSIGAVLKTKSGCFVEKKSVYCGNYRVDAGEGCDPGFHVHTDGDPCCNSECKLRPNAQCSDANDMCCKDCKLISAAAHVPCLKQSSDTCILDTICDGMNRSCPPAPMKPDGTECFNRGRCRAGICKSFCVYQDSKTCSCDTEKDACKRCCFDEKGLCAPVMVNGAPQFLDDGIPCVFGICNSNGKCLGVTRSPVIRLWDILDLSSASGFVKFMRNNIVMTILVISVVLWLPMSCFICYLDRRASREREALTREVVDEELDDDVRASPRTSPRPVGKWTANRRANQKENIRKIVKNAA